MLAILARPTNRNFKFIVDACQASQAEVDSRLGKLYDALETGEFKDGDLAPRIKTLFEKKEQLQQAKVAAEEALKYQTIELADLQ